jgi:ABC-type uncharacterized transport system substrate-binding protein
LRRLAILLNTGSSYAVLEKEEVQTAARALGLEVATFEIRRAEDFAAIFDTLKSHADAIYVVPDPFINVNRTRITTLALGARLPTIHGFREFVEAGGLMSYGPNWTDMFGRAAGYVDKLDLPCSRPTPWLHAGGTNPGSTPAHSHCRSLRFCLRL